MTLPRLATSALLIFALSAAAAAQPGGRKSSPRPTSVPSNTERPKPQSQPPTTPAPGKTAPLATGAGTPVSFAPEPFRLDAIGLIMRVPEGCSAQSTTIAGRATTQITPKDTTWILNVQVPARTTETDTTIAEMAEKTITLIQGSFGILDTDNKTILETRAEVLERDDNVRLEGGVASRFYISVPGAGDARIIKGYTIFRPTLDQFVVFELITAASEFSRARGVYETVLGTAQFTDNLTMMAERGAFIKTGQAFFDRLTESDYLDAMHEKKLWQRLSQPAATGSPSDATELGYRGVRFWRGRRGEVDPDKPRSAWSRSENDEGFLCSVEGRFLLKGGIADSRGIYFMKPDRSEETWSVKTVFTDSSGKQVSAATDTGARTGQVLSIIKKETGQPLTTLTPTGVGEGYISKFETFLLPRLMIRKNVNATIGSYAWSDQERVLSFRKDEMQRDPAPGSLITIKTSFREEAASQSYTYSPTGDLVRGEVEGLGVWEPIEPEQLMRLWKQKGLPTDK